MKGEKQLSERDKESKSTFPLNKRKYLCACLCATLPYMTKEMNHKKSAVLQPSLKEARLEIYGHEKQGEKKNPQQKLTAAQWLTKANENEQVTVPLIPF